jgi:hypothetical protein
MKICILDCIHLDQMALNAYRSENISNELVEKYKTHIHCSLHPSRKLYSLRNNFKGI